MSSSYIVLRIVVLQLFDVEHATGHPIEVAGIIVQYIFSGDILDELVAITVGFGIVY